ncbi:uncharacterized protein LOC123561531 [Mercenaria mercenaria]|uniref:uncharacterized protein LOC123561531 n=1 Tax=Mercenaria mercenaria TaxID=6596 RepID=UPI00234F17C4|nr:uncharacterized protein LOC123561531 [Mercenaria mercenaria]
MPCLLYLIFVIITVAFVTTLIALAVPVWQDSSVQTVMSSVTVKTYTYSGLWSVCTRTEIVGMDTLSCDTYLEDAIDYPGSVKGVQAMMIIGGALSAAAFVAIILKWCCFKTSDILGKIVSILCIGAAVFLLIGAIVWSTKVKKDQGFDAKDLNAGFALTIIAAALLLVAGVVVCFLES